MTEKNELPAPSPAAIKASLRARFRAFRAGLTDAEYERRSQAIVVRLKTLPELHEAGAVHLFWPMLTRREVDLRSLVHWLQTQKKQIVLPVVRTFSRGGDGSTGRLEHVRFSGLDDLRMNKWGIFEPFGTETVPVEGLDAVIVPALGAGRNGHRIGHGLGYYDEFLRDVQVPRICPTYEACLVDDVPAEPHDVPMTVIVTEQTVVRPACL